MKQLTLEELEQMPGQPVWCEDLEVYGIIKCEFKGRWSGKPFLVGVFYSEEYGMAHNFEYDIQRRKLKCYRVIDEKQIPKKPKNMRSILDFSGNCYTSKGDCPNCGRENLYKSDIYCNKCGQKLDWDFLNQEDE